MRKRERERERERERDRERERETNKIYVTDESYNFVVEDCFALNCNLSSFLIFPNKGDTQ